MNIKYIIAALLLPSAVAAGAVGTLSLDSCRQLALSNNKELLMQAEKVKAAGYQKREAFAAYLPAIDFAGGYMYNQKNISIFDKDQLLPTKSFNAKTGSYEFNLVTDPATHMPVKGPDGQYIPETVALIPKDAMTFDIHNVVFGAVTLTQPIYMGGKIVAMNKMAGYAEELYKDMNAAARQDVVYAVDAAYWQVVSLAAKHQLATSYVALLDSLDRNVGYMVDAGVATRSDKLTVDVKLNEAQIDLTKVENGLTLSRMLLAQLCGLPVESDIHVVDEMTDDINTEAEIATTYDMQRVYDARHDVRALTMATKIADQQSAVAMSSMLPNVALIGSYSFSNPNMFDGYKKNFDGAFSVGVMVKVPLWHWGGNYNKYRAAKAERKVAELKLEDAKEKITLQVSQAAFKAREAMKTYLMTITNETKANENLENARVGFTEGVLTTDNVLEAQTAWLKAHSEKIDAMIEVQLCDVYLNKVLGRTDY
ncbi:MAG: TolC family protein [Muribaculaceae bacterium]|nr:TolC family protein [Muribaculaceae bacterium]